MEGKFMKELLIKILEFFGLACWIEISTDIPRCTYYFGPFLTKKAAQLAKDGYIEDLKYEGSQNIVAHIKRFKPNELTIFDELELGETNNVKNFFILNSQPSLNI
jgi:hypothetical protein